MKKTALFLALTIGAISVSAQAIWNKKLPVSSALNTFSELIFANGSYWVSSDQGLFQIGETGDITGRITKDNGFAQFWVWGAQISPSPAAPPYYLLARLTTLSGSGYTIAHYRPDLGVVNQISFTDTSGSITQTRGPVFARVDDSTLLVFGRSVIRKIQHRENGSITEGWAKLLSFKTNDAVWTGSQAIFCDAFGDFKAVDANGNLLWQKNPPIQFKIHKTVA